MACGRVARLPGLLLQHFQEVACTHLAAMEQRLPHALESYGDAEQATSIAALMQLLVSSMTLTSAINVTLVIGEQYAVLGCMTGRVRHIEGC